MPVLQLRSGTEASFGTCTNALHRHHTSRQASCIGWKDQIGYRLPIFCANKFAPTVVRLHLAWRRFEFIQTTNHLLKSNKKAGPNVYPVFLFSVSMS